MAYIGPTAGQRLRGNRFTTEQGKRDGEQTTNVHNSTLANT